MPVAIIVISGKGNWMLKVKKDYKNTRKTSPEQRHWFHSRM